MGFEVQPSVSNGTSSINSTFGDSCWNSSSNSDSGFYVWANSNFASVSLAHSTISEVKSVINSEISSSLNTNDTQNRIFDGKKSLVVLFLVIFLFASSTMFIIVAPQSFQNFAVQHQNTFNIWGFTIISVLNSENNSFSQNFLAHNIIIFAIFRFAWL